MKPRPFLLTLAPALYLLVFLAVPTLLLLPLAFATRGPYGEIELHFTCENLSRLAGFSILGYSPDYLIIAGRTVFLAAATTLLCLGIAYPLAFYIASLRPAFRYTWLILLVIPFATNLLIRTAGLQALMAPNLPPARVLALLHIVPRNEWLFPSTFAVYLGMVSASLPFTLLPLYTSVERLDRTLIEAAQDLYASRVRTFRHAILPQTLPGLIAATLITFIPTLGTFLISDLLGGAKTMLLGNLLQQQFGDSRDYPFGAAVSFLLILATLLALLLPRKTRLRA